MNNLTHAIIYDLNTSSQLDVLEQEFVMGYIVRNVDHCMTFSKPERKVTFRDIMINSMSGWLMFLMMAPLMFGSSFLMSLFCVSLLKVYFIIVGVVYNTRKSRNVALGSREKGA